MRLTKESQQAGADLWGAIDGGSEKSAVEHVVTVGEPTLSCGPPMRDAYVFEHGDFKVAADLPVGEAMQKIAGFWADNARGVVESLRTIVSGGKTWGSDLLGRRVPMHQVDKLTQAEGAQLGLAGAAVAGTLGIGTAVINKANERRRFNQVERTLLEDPWFSNLSDKSLVNKAYGLMVKYSPSMAADPIVARSFVRMLVQSEADGGMDNANIGTVQELLEAEKKFRDSGAFTEDLFDLRRSMRGGARVLGLAGGKSSP